MVSLTCPNCGAMMEFDEERDTIFCSYCGQKLLIDYRTRKVKIEKNININHNINKKVEKHIVDEAKIEKEKNEKYVWLFLTVVLGIYFLGTFIALILHG